MPSLANNLLAHDLDILHLHGIWQYPSIAGSAWQRRTGRPYIVSPQGMLDEWILARGRVKKFIARKLYEQRNITDSVLVQATTLYEADQIRRFAPTARKVVIPNSVDIPNRARNDDSAAKINGGDKVVGYRYILFLSRLHQKKNIETAIDAWIALRERKVFSDCRFLIAGTGQASYVRRIERKVKKLGSNSGIEMLGPIYGDRKGDILSRAQFLILPSHSEGMPLVVLEAWSEGVPVLMSEYCYIPEGFRAGAAINSGVTRASVQAAMETALLLPPDERQAMSDAARKLMDEKFSSEVTTAAWLAAYKSVLEQK